jgi:glycosyltransferase involved in cell wall biosynthesis
MDTIKTNGSEQKNIVLFTSNFVGGIVQFTMQLARVLKRQNYSVTVFLPDNAQEADASGAVDICSYRRFKSIKTVNRHSVDIAERMIRIKPDLILFCDEGILCSQIIKSLKGACKTTMVIHDVTPHPEKFSLYEQLKDRIQKRTLRKALAAADRIVLLSDNSYQLFNSLYPAFEEKASWMPLGAHVPEADPKKPVELAVSDESEYYLFFGRISKYKGVGNLLRAYEMIGQAEKPILVVAGSGELQPDEKELADRSNGVLLINRFIQDDEMLYLIKNALAVVLPYIEASQSGVIPIAYHFGVPVIISNVAGLKEFVKDGATGVVCSDIAAIRDAMLNMNDDGFRQKLSKGAQEFYRERLNWDSNVQKCVEPIAAEQAE